MCHYLKGAPASNSPPSHLSSPDLFRLREHAVLFSARLGSQGEKEERYNRAKTKFVCLIESDSLLLFVTGEAG